MIGRIRGSSPHTRRLFQLRELRYGRSQTLSAHAEVVPSASTAAITLADPLRTRGGCSKSGADYFVLWSKGKSVQAVSRGGWQGRELTDIDGVPVVCVPKNTWRDRMFRARIAKVTKKPE